MKRNYKIIALVVVIAAVLWSFIPFKNTNDPKKNKLLLELLSFVLKQGHYSPVDFDDDFSEDVYTDYIEGLDPTKRFFIQTDIDTFAKYETQIDDLLKNKDLSFFNLTYSRLKQRMKESRNIYKTILKEPFNFNKNEQINVDYEKIPYPKNKNEQIEHWRKQLKLSVLSAISDKQQIENNKIKKDSTYTPLSFVEIEEEARKNTLKSLNEYFDFIDDELDENDWFSIYLNSIASRFDPHTFYFSPDDKEKFDISMSGKFEGIGARLQKKDQNVKITELISGGPAWRGKQLEAGDVILKVGQGEEEPITIAGMRLDDVIKKIKGPKGTEVRLTVRKVDGSIVVIPIIRDEVETEETFAKSTIVEKEGEKFGVIYLPKFYITFDDRTERDAFKDVSQEIERLKKEGIKGLIIDLRGNGGGSLETVVNMTGLFIEKGPVVQVKSLDRAKKVLKDKDPQIQWKGPLVVMVDNYSASASEIFAAAIQDYKRGIVIGGNHTYGKGTVQNVIDLNRFVRNSSFGDFGAVKTTTQKFYRINGGSTQKKGVESDIVLPNQLTYMDSGERDEKYALEWDKIDPANYSVVSSGFASIIEKSKQRTDSSAYFKLIKNNAQWIANRRNEYVYDLNIKQYEEKQKEIDDTIKKFKKIKEYSNRLQFQSLPYEVERFTTDTILKEKRVRWHEDLQKDIYMNEALNVLYDLEQLQLSKK